VTAPEPDEAGAPPPDEAGAPLPANLPGAPTEIVMADVVRALDTGFRMDLNLAAAALRGVTYAEAVYHLLVDKGILTREEVEATVERFTPVVTKAFEAQGTFVHHAAAQVDKYDMAEVEEAGDIDCENRIHLCQGACCTFDFTLSQQDIDEGIVQWEFEDPYAIRHGDDGHCVHQDGATRRCGVYANRPAVCREYSCRNDPRVWADFEGYVPAADLDATLKERRRRRSHVLLGPPRRRAQLQDPTETAT
jgi:Fe-S-cluster containining protein